MRWAGRPPPRPPRIVHGRPNKVHLLQRIGVDPVSRLVRVAARRAIPDRKLLREFLDNDEAVDAVAIIAADRFFGGVGDESPVLDFLRWLIESGALLALIEAIMAMFSGAENAGQLLAKAEEVVAVSIDAYRQQRTPTKQAA